MNVIIDSLEFDQGLEARIEANLKEDNEVTLENYSAAFHGNMCLQLGKTYECSFFLIQTKPNAASREIQIRTVSTRRPGGLRWAAVYMSNRRAKWDIARRVLR